MITMLLKNAVSLLMICLFALQPMVTLYANVKGSQMVTTQQKNNDSKNKTHSRYKNVIFDLGGVLIFFSLAKTVEHIRSLGVDVPDIVAQKILKANHLHEHLEYNRGVLTREEYTDKASKHLFDEPAHQALARQILMMSEELIRIIPEGYHLFDVIKRQGYKTYVLSNMCADVEQQLISQDATFFDRFDGVCLSYKANHVKPEEAFYKKLLETYGLNPSECIFIDDVQMNIDAGKKLGIDGVLYQNLEQVLSDLKAQGVIS